MKQTITATLVVWNEEKMIRGCLENIKDSVDEIIVVHDGPCDDNTLAISSEYTERIFIHPRVGASVPIGPYIFNLAKGDWVLIIDADERISPGLKSKLPELIKSEEFDSFSFFVPFYHNGRPIKQTLRRSKRLFRKKFMYHIGLPHVSVETYGKEKDADLNIEHYWDPKQVKHLSWSFIKKNVNRGKIAEKMLAGDTKDIPVFQTSLWNKNLKHHRKYKLLRDHPFLALCCIPFISFFIHFVIKKYYRDGYLGFGHALEVPTYYFWTALFLIRRKLKNTLRI